jgi:1-aminocyclopropane-1-carboxylate deaminase/D-cysteine desulfhydrase-like pyridoxal-dependent ACC family enzyme
MLAGERKNWDVNEDYHFGGYAKQQPELERFIKWFQQKHGIPLDRIYTGKMFYGIYDLIMKKKIAENTRIVAVHTGGLQGNAGFPAI